MTVLTWRNLAVPVAGPESALEFASRAFNAGMNNFNRGLESYQAQQGDAFQVAKAKNMQEFTDAIRSQFKTPEAYQAALQSGEIDRMRQQYGDRIDANAAMRLADSRLGTLRNEVLQANDYTNTQQKFVAAPLIDQAKAFYAKGQFDKGDSVIEGNVDKLRNYLGDLASYRNSSQIGLNTLKASNRSEAIANAIAPTALETAVLTEKNKNAQAKEIGRVNEEIARGDALIRNAQLEAAANESLRKQAIDVLNKEFGFKTNKDGYVDYNKEDPTKVTQYFEKLKAAGITGNETGSREYSNAAKLIAGFHPQAAAALTQRLQEVTRLGGIASPDAIDKANASIERINAKAAEVAKVNPFYQDMNKLPDQLKTLSDKVYKDFKSEYFSQRDMVEKVNDIALNGLTFKNKAGITVNIPVSMKTLELAYEATKETNSKIGPNGTEQRMGEFLENYLSLPANSQLFQEAEDLRNNKHKVAIADIKSNLSKNTGVITSYDIFRDAESANADALDKLKEKNRQDLRIKESLRQEAERQKLETLRLQQSNPGETDTQNLAFRSVPGVPNIAPLFNPNLYRNLIK